METKEPDTATEQSRSKRGRFGPRGTVTRIQPALEALKRSRPSRILPDSLPSGGEESSTSPSAPPAKRQLIYPVTGRRAVQLCTLAEGLRRCTNPSCLSELHLSDCTQEQRYGLASVLLIPCRSCSFVNRVDTDSRVDSSEKRRGPPAFASNRKVAIGKSAEYSGKIHICIHLKKIQTCQRYFQNISVISQSNIDVLFQSSTCI